MGAKAQIGGLRPMSECASSIGLMGRGCAGKQQMFDCNDPTNAVIQFSTEHTMPTDDCGLLHHNCNCLPTARPV